MARSRTTKKKVAIFDVDGTIFRSSLIEELVRDLVKTGAFPPQARHIYEKAHEQWQAREGEYDVYINGVVSAFCTYLPGVSYTLLHASARKVSLEHKDRVYRYTRDLVKELAEKGYFLLAISQSPKIILEDFCKNLGFHKTYGRIYETGPDEKFTGKIVDLHLIANKANVVRRAMEKENLTLANSVGVGDTEGDIPFLEMVEKPICFNPNDKLYRYARLMKWPVVVERKNVVYRVQ